MRVLLLEATRKIDIKSEYCILLQEKVKQMVFKDHTN